MTESGFAEPQISGSGDRCEAAALEQTLPGCASTGVPPLTRRALRYREGAELGGEQRVDRACNP